MAGLLNIGEMGALALHSMLDVAKLDRKDDKKWISTSDLAENLGASRHTLHKVVKRLVHAGLLESARGPQGGVRMRKSPEAITLMNIIEAVDGTVDAGGCLFARRVCSKDNLCQFCGITMDLEQSVRGYFGKTTLEELLNKMGVDKETSQAEV